MIANDSNHFSLEASMFVEILSGDAANSE